jgi:hypothetical protein
MGRGDGRCRGRLGACQGINGGPIECGAQERMASQQSGDTSALGMQLRAAAGGKALGHGGVWTAPIPPPHLCPQSGAPCSGIQEPRPLRCHQLLRLAGGAQLDEGQVCVGKGWEQHARQLRLRSRGTGPGTRVSGAAAAATGQGNVVAAGRAIHGAGCVVSHSMRAGEPPQTTPSTTRTHPSAQCPASPASCRSPCRGPGSCPPRWPAAQSWPPARQGRRRRRWQRAGAPRRPRPAPAPASSAPGPPARAPPPSSQAAKPSPPP